ncbi:hypothetical protein [Bradyrhizobium erythrophlei]|uniref:Uncharacterized protein n=1 Tax=Bradyrhizobium erythrophlei TaxID=1437360 RepID=A0A1M5H3F2_9BRAD|nr:hypothetical protein [Bradyrhizobium erythrophlei]SHG10423.1 hypothetical protein SAMN05443248_0298 [Bradyrhizobium erythrophlei]
MADEIIASHLIAHIGYGDQADQTPSSLPIDKLASIKRSPISKSIRAASGVVRVSPTPDWQTRAVTSEQKVPTHPSMRNRSGEGGKIGHTIDRGKK